MGSQRDEQDLGLTHSEDDDGDEGDEEQDVEIPGPQPRPDAVYNTLGLHEKLEEIGWPPSIDWMHGLSVTVQQPNEIDDVNDDLAREMAFYTQALEGTRQAYRKLEAKGIPFLRPEDYYAEMVKTDAHMFKVKDKLVFQHRKIEEAEERRKAREAKRFAKEVQSQKLKDRAKKKKQDIESVKKWRKLRKGSGFTEGEDDFPVDFGDRPPAYKKMKVAPWDRSGGNAKEFKGGKAASRGKPNKGGSSKRREFRNAKFGHGGKKGFNKKNTAESAADVSGFKRRFRRGKNEK